MAYLFQPDDPGYEPGVTKGLVIAEEALDQKKLGGYCWNGINNASLDDMARFRYVGANGTSIGTGMQNTQIMARAYPKGQRPRSAGTLAREYRGNGYTDWFLPSLYEMMAIAENRALFGGLPGTARGYWTSSEWDNGHAWVVKSKTALPENSYKHASGILILPVRAFTFPESGPKVTKPEPRKPVVDPETENLKIGDDYGGGIVLYIMMPGDHGYVEGETHGIIIAKEDIDTGFERPRIPGTDRYPWIEPKAPKKTTGATATVVGWATSNTDKILDTYPAKLYPHSAAAVARSYRGGGFSDWSLPTVNELQLVSKYRGSFSRYRNFNRKTGQTGRCCSSHWTSTECQYNDRSYAFRTYGKRILQTNTSGFNKVRPVRYF